MTVSADQKHSSITAGPSSEPHRFCSMSQQLGSVPSYRVRTGAMAWKNPSEHSPWPAP